MTRLLTEEDYRALVTRITDLELHLNRLDEPPGPDGTWTVYRIYPEGLPDQVFYIGLTGDFHARVSGHNSSPDSAVYTKVRALDAVDIHCTMDRIGVFTNRESARMFETYLIATTPGLLNRDVEACQKRVGAISASR